MKGMSKSKQRSLFLFLILVGLPALSLLPRAISLDQHWSSDEALWLNRSRFFIFSLQHGDFQGTLQSYHPGVTTMWITGLRTFFVDVGADLPNLIFARFFISVSVCIGIGICGLLLFRLFGRWEAITSVVFLAFSPFFLAQTRRVHTDALMVIFTLLTVLLFLLYCKNWQSSWYLVLSGVTFGLAILSKSHSLILVVWAPVCLFLFWKYRGEISGHASKFLATLLCFLSCGMLTVIALWPALWNPTSGLLGLSLLGTIVISLDVMKKQDEQKQKGHSRIKTSILLLLTASIVLAFVSPHVMRAVGLIWDKISWAVTTPHEVEHFFLGKVVNDPG